MAPTQRARALTVAGVAAAVGITAVAVRAARKMSQSPTDAPDALHLAKAITVRKPVEDVYAFWRNFRNLPSFMRHLESVAVFDERRSHWTARGPAGQSVEWDAEMVQDQPNALIAWRSLPGAAVSHSGTVRFSAAPGGRGTEVRIDMDYTPPAGRLGAIVAKFFGEEPHQQVQADLRKFKQVMETGEVIRSEATVGGAHILQRPATTLPVSEPTGARS